MRTGCVPVSGTFMFYLSTPNYLLSHLYTFICVHNPKTSLNISTILTTKPIINLCDACIFLLAVLSGYLYMGKRIVSSKDRVLDLDTLFIVQFMHRSSFCCNIFP